MQSWSRIWRIPVYCSQCQPNPLHSLHFPCSEDMEIRICYNYVYIVPFTLNAPYPQTELMNGIWYFKTQPKCPHLWKIWGDSYKQNLLSLYCAPKKLFHTSDSSQDCVQPDWTPGICLEGICFISVTPSIAQSITWSRGLVNSSIIDLKIYIYIYIWFLPYHPPLKN